MVLRFHGWKSNIFKRMPSTPYVHAHRSGSHKDDDVSNVSDEKSFDVEQVHINVGGPFGNESNNWIMVIALCGLVSILCSLDRTAMSIAILPLSKTYHWSDSVKGYISGAFNVGHVITNLWGGYLASAYAPKWVLCSGVATWSIFTILTPPACRAPPQVTALVRALMGLGEGVAFPTMQAVARGWVPSQSRSKALSFMFAGHQFGSILAMLISPFVIQALGVDSMFYVYGLLGFVWILACWRLFSERAPLAGSTTVASPPCFRELPWRDILSNKTFWSLALCHSMFGVVYNIGIAWLPTFFSESFGLDVRGSSLLSVAPWVAMAGGTLSAGFAADALIHSYHLSHTLTRKTLQILGAAGPGICLLYLAALEGRVEIGGGATPTSVVALASAVANTTVGVLTGRNGTHASAGSGFTAGQILGGGDVSKAGSSPVLARSFLASSLSPEILSASLPTMPFSPAAQQPAAALSPGGAAFVLSLTMGLLGLQAGGFASTHQDIAGSLAPVLFGLTNSAASMAGSACVMIVGALLESTGSWALVFQLVAGCCLGSAGVFVALASAERQFR